MSEQLTMWDDGPSRVGNNDGAASNRAGLAREMRFLLASSTQSGRGFKPSPSGLAHSIGVCLIEDFNMSRGKGKQSANGNAASMPKFIDVKLTAEERVEFSSWAERGGDLVTFLQSLADDGYRVGVSWSGETQSYTVSLTCRNTDSPNNGYCMTSFAKTLAVALWLAVYKHVVVTEEDWTGYAGAPEGEFG